MYYIALLCASIIIIIAEGILIKHTDIGVDEVFSYGLSNHTFVDTIEMKPQDGYVYQKGIEPFVEYMAVQKMEDFNMQMCGRTSLKMFILPYIKDTVYRFMKMVQINWMRFTTILASRIINNAILPLDSEDRANVLIIDDSMFERNRSKKVELLAKVYDHAKHKYRFGFRMLTLGWSDGSTFLPVNSILLSTENKKNRINEAAEIDKRTVGYRRRKLSMEKGTHAMLTLLETAKKAAIPAKYVLFDSWFSSPSTLHAVKRMDFDVIGMVKKSPKMFFRYDGEDMSLISIYNKNKKRRGKSKYLLSVMVDVVKDGDIIPAKVVYVRNRNKRKEYLCLISTDVNLDENEIIRIYGKRWDIEVFFKVCKSYLNLSRECNSLSYDAMTAHTAVVFTRYMMLSLESRESNDNRSLGELFLYFSDEMSDITWI